MATVSKKEDNSSKLKTPGSSARSGAGRPGGGREADSASIQAERKSGRIWTVSADGKAVPISVVIGITDGTFSEIISGELNEGTDVIVGEAAKSNQVNRGTASPFWRRTRRSA